MNWYKIAQEKDFKLTDIVKNFWNSLLKKEMDRVKISFDLENNESFEKNKTIKGDKEIVVKKKDGSLLKKKYRIFAQLIEAGGDWQNPAYYFRCQLATKSSSNIWDEGEYTSIFIPSKEEGNINLIKDGKDFVPTEDEHPKEKDEKKLWISMENHFKNILKKNLKEKDEKKFNIYKKKSLFEIV